MTVAKRRKKATNVPTMPVKTCSRENLFVSEE